MWCIYPNQAVASHAMQEEVKKEVSEVLEKAAAWEKVSYGRVQALSG